MRAYGYCRYSTDRQTENSIAYQMAEICKYCTSNDITLLSCFTDEGESATNMDRPGFQALLSAVRRGECEAIIIYDITRGSRDVADWFGFRREMMRLGVTVISASQPLGDITNPNDFLVELISVGLGQHTLLDTRKKSIDGVAVRAKEGAFLGGTPPLGYEIVNGSYVVNDVEAANVHTIFDLYAKGRSYNHILDALHGACGKFGRPLEKNSLYSILTNERYIGVYTWNKRKVKLFRKWAGGESNPNCVRLEGAIPPIVDQKTWDEVQKRMMANKRGQNKAKRTYLLSGLIECEVCGATYVGHTSRNTKGYETSTYICGNRYRTRNCQSHNVNADDLETFVVQHLKMYLLQSDFDDLSADIANKVNSATPSLYKERRELQEITAKIKNGVEYILKGNSIPELNDELDRLRSRKSELEDIINHHEAHRPAIDPADIVALFRDAVANWDDQHLYDIIHQHITKIYAHADGTFTVNIGVHITGCGGRT